ncbi:MAG: hypothetical protein R2932_52190 [Caldilineaceae bacterium]
MNGAACGSSIRMLPRSSALYLVCLVPAVGHVTKTIRGRALCHFGVCTGVSAFIQQTAQPCQEFARDNCISRLLKTQRTVVGLSWSAIVTQQRLYTLPIQARPSVEHKMDIVPDNGKTMYRCAGWTNTDGAHEASRASKSLSGAPTAGQPAWPNGPAC